MSDKFNIRNLPPEGHPDVGPFFWRLWQAGIAEKERLNLHDKFLNAYRMYRGAHWDQKKKRLLNSTRVDKLTANLLFANIQRTVANITARAPVAEVVSLDGQEDDADTLLSSLVAKWNNESEQAKNLSSSVLRMEIYGITIEKAVFNLTTEQTSFVILDPYAFGIAPGYFADINDAPYLTHHYPMPVPDVEATYKTDGVHPEERLSYPGDDREDHRPIPTGTSTNTQNYPGNYSDTQHPVKIATDVNAPALVVEVWVRDWTLETIEIPDTDSTGAIKIGLDGEIITKKLKQSKYPGGIRVVTLTNQGDKVLADKPNPNINPEIDRELTEKTYLFNRFPFFKANSYEDDTSLWGFSAEQQVGDINLKIDEMMTRLSQYLNRCLLPTLILPKDSGVLLSDVSNRPGLVLQPSSGVAGTGIRYLQPPSLPADFFEALNWYVSIFDRVSQIEDADRGVAPSGVIAAQAIVALQERGAVLIRAKIRSVDYLVRERGRCAINFFQNFGQMEQQVDVQGNQEKVTGLMFLGREFNYIVESGSTVARTSLQVQEQAMDLYEKGAIDRRALLEALNFPDWKNIVERAGEGQLDQALQILIDAGLEEQVAAELKQFLMQPQGGPGDAGGSADVRPPQEGEVNA